MGHKSVRVQVDNGKKGVSKGDQKDSLYFFQDYFEPIFAYRFKIMGRTVSSIMGHKRFKVQIDNGKKVYIKVFRTVLYW